MFERASATATLLRGERIVVRCHACATSTTVSDHDPGKSAIVAMFRQTHRGHPLEIDFRHHG